MKFNFFSFFKIHFKVVFPHSILSFTFALLTLSLSSPSPTNDNHFQSTSSHTHRHALTHKYILYMYTRTHSYISSHIITAAAKTKNSFEVMGQLKFSLFFTCLITLILFRRTLFYFGHVHTLYSIRWARSLFDLPFHFVLALAFQISDWIYRGPGKCPPSTSFVLYFFKLCFKAFFIVVYSFIKRRKIVKIVFLFFCFYCLRTK